MYNYANLSDYEFELLCRDIMEKKLGRSLRCFAPGKDGGVDVTESKLSNEVMIQVKRYISSPFSELLSSLRKELPKVQKKQPKHYYVCCAKQLTLRNITAIYELFEEYMQGPEDVVDLGEIDKFLHRKENEDVLECHYKLWLESTNILERIYHQDVFIDCESLLYDIDKEKKIFVATGYYEQCRKILEEERMLLLLGNPGVGKTMTSKMLALYFAAKGYRIRYTTDHDISNLKAALSRDKDRPEVLLLDDCLGQHYFKMQDTRENELLALIKYIRMNRKKILIMNSRVTIFQEAKERSGEFRYFMEDQTLKIRKIEMKQLKVEEKGQIFYNHLYFSDIPEGYRKDIIRDKNYRRIVAHQNYTPRVIEFVTKKGNYTAVEPDRYAEYIMNCLDNPKELWSDEFLRRLGPEDRALLLTLYSLTDTMVEEGILIRAYKRRMESMPQHDATRNVYQDALKRLTGSMVHILSDREVRKIGVCNPSINDFLKSYTAEKGEGEEMPGYATEFVQLQRMCPNQIEGMIRNGRIYEFHFKNQSERYGYILNNICQNNIMAECHREFVEEFLTKLPLCMTVFGDRKISILMSLLTETFDAYYHTRKLLNEKALKDMLQTIDLEDYHILHREIYEKGNQWFLQKYEDALISGLQQAVDVHMNDVLQEDYYEACDISAILEDHTYYESGYEECDYTGAAREIAEKIKDDVCDEIHSIISLYPQSVYGAIFYDEGDVNISIYDIKQYLEAWSSSYFYEDEFVEDDDTESGEDILDVMFR